MFGSKFAIPVLVIAVLAFAVTPAALAFKSSMNPQSDNGLVTMQGTVTAFLYDDDWENETHDDHNDTDHEVNDTNDDHNDTDDELNEIDHHDEDLGAEIESVNNKTHEPRASAFVIDNDTIVEFGPWWYWNAQNVTVTDVVHVGDVVNVTGELENEDGMNVLEAWHIKNLTTGKELTIREEGRPPWAGGPKALDIDPRLLSHNDE